MTVLTPICLLIILGILIASIIKNYNERLLTSKILEHDKSNS